MTTNRNPDPDPDPTAILNDLNLAQRTAVSSPSPILQVLAPPGSGKTKTLTARVAYLLTHHGYRPQDVICCTFTIKASREMRERIARLIGGKVEGKLVLGTFHSICRRYLVNYGYLIGLQRGFGIADSGDSLAIIRVCTKYVLYRLWQMLILAQRIVQRLRLAIQPNTARARISHQKAHGIDPEQAAAKYSNRKILEQQEFVRVYYEYEQELATCNLLDYDDLLVRCVELLRRHPECVSNVQAVLVDEFQDTNHIQYELMNLFASANRRITIVGDPDQSIYGFRSAEIKNLSRMQNRYRDTSIVLLEDNYRSSGSILSSAQDVIEQDTSRPAKKLQPTHSVGTLPVLRRLPSAVAEAQWIVLEIQRCVAMTGGLLNYSDFAILLRSAALSRQIESEMGKVGMPYRMVGGLRFFDRVEIKLLLDYMRVVSSPGNSEALLRIINVPPRRIGDETVRMLSNGAQAANLSLWNFIKDVAQGRKSTEKTLTKLTDQGLCSFVGIIESSRQKLLECTDRTAPKKLLEFIIKKLSFRDYLTTLHGQNEENRWANVEELLNQASDNGPQDDGEEGEEGDLPPIEGIAQQQAHPGEDALSHFLANVALSTEVKPPNGEQEGEQQSDEKVTISTIHAAKGLEWPVVFVPAVYNGIIPHSRAEDQDEERRLLYVAMTRAQALLYLSVPLRVSRNDEETEMSPSSFISQKIIDARFRPTGPKLLEKIVYGIADILHRPRPSPADMLKARREIPSTCDDRWTAEGREHPDAVTKWDGSVVGQEEPCPKRRKYDQASGKSTTTFMSSSAYTMSNASNFSVPTTMSSGFSTAREYIATDAAKQASRESGEKPKHSGTGNATNRKGSGGSLSQGKQGSIANYFGQPASSKALPQPQPRSQAEQSNPAFRRSAVPSQFSTHRLPQPQTLQPPRPALEASDPNSYTWLATPSAPPGKSINRQKQALPSQEENGGERRAERGVDGVIKNNSGSNSTRPVNTFHTTTMSMVQQQPVRKTLGIRRTMMNGWQERMSRAANGNSGP